MLSASKIISKAPGPLSKMVVFLHGYGASGEDLIGLSHSFESLLPPTVFLAPNGPDRCDANVFGYQWFGLPDFSPTNMRLGLDRIRPVLENYLRSLLTQYQLSPQDLALVGFSQGTIVALEMMFAIPDIRCILGYSGAFFCPPSPPLPLAKVMLIHGDLDTVVPYPIFLQSKKQLTDLGIQVEAHTCPGVLHTIDEKGIQLGARFLAQNLSLDNS